MKRIYFPRRRDVLYFRDIAVEPFMTFSEIKVPCKQRRIMLLQLSFFSLLLLLLLHQNAFFRFLMRWNDQIVQWAISAVGKLVQTMLSPHFHHLFTSGWRGSYSIEIEFYRSKLWTWVSLNYNLFQSDWRNTFKTWKVMHFWVKKCF